MIYFLGQLGLGSSCRVGMGGHGCYNTEACGQIHPWIQKEYPNKQSLA